MSAEVRRRSDRLSLIGDATHEAFAPFVKASDFFTMGNCHQLALALVAAIDGASFVALYDDAGVHKGVSERPRLVHAAAKIGDRILDIEDFVGESIWLDAWSDLARDPNLVEYEAGELPFEFTSSEHQSFSEGIATRLANYWANEIERALSTSCAMRPQRSMMFA